MTNEQKRAVFRIVCALVLCVAGMLLPLQNAVRLGLFFVSYLLVGYDVVWDAVRMVAHGEWFDEHFLMTIATLGAFAIGEYPEAAGVMLFYQIGELFQDMAVGNSKRSIAALLALRPDCAVVLRGGQEETVAPEAVQIGELVLVRPGEKIPLDGVVVTGTSAVNASALTGESAPMSVAVGDRVHNGTVNGSGVLQIRTESCFADSTVAKILALVENASEKKARVENFITRFAKYYTPCVVIGAVLLALVPPLLFGQAWALWINRALIFLMVSCPCALVVSVPLTFFSGIGGASRAGILIKGANDLEALSHVDTIAFDKTGTLTKGCFAVDAIHPQSLSQAALLDIAAAAEQYSTHPVGESIVAAHHGHIDQSRIGTVTELAGKGLCAEIDGVVYAVGNEALMRDVNVAFHACHRSGTVIHIAEAAKEGVYLGHIVINDVPKPEAKTALAQLKADGIRKTVMLTGDTLPVANAVGATVGVDALHAQLLPADKVSVIETLLDEGGTVAFVGDGINDAPVLARANVGVAMGALGSDAAIESADVVLMDDNLMKLPLAIRIARKTMRIVRQNIVLALGVKIGILALSVCGLTTMWTAVFGDVGVLILAVLNALRAMRMPSIAPAE